MRMQRTSVCHAFFAIIGAQLLQILVCELGHRPRIFLGYLVCQPKISVSRTIRSMDDNTGNSGDGHELSSLLLSLVIDEEKEDADGDGLMLLCLSAFNNTTSPSRCPQLRLVPT